MTAAISGGQMRGRSAYPYAPAGYRETSQNLTFANARTARPGISTSSLV
jgi:hypothetical protein